MNISTERLSLQYMSLEHAPFMFYLMNSPNWKEFIGDRSIHSVEDAEAYVQRIIDLEDTFYWVIKRNEDGKLIGVVTFMKRENLEHFDIGFALLPGSFAKGFAFEATAAVLEKVTIDSSHTKILGITIPTNIRSIRLLERLGFTLESEKTQDDEILLVFGKDY